MLLFLLCELCHFLTSDSMKVYRQWVPCERNSSYNFIPIFLKLCTCFCHGLEMCIWFGYNHWINFYYFFHFVNFVIFWPQILWKCMDSGYHVSATPYTTSCLSLFNFAHLFVHGLKMSMWFGFNPAVIFCHFFNFVNFVIFRRCDINFTEVRSIFYCRRQKLIYELNSSGKYFAFKEQLKHSVVKIVREKYLKTTNFEDRQELQV